VSRAVRIILVRHQCIAWDGTTRLAVAPCSRRFTILTGPADVVTNVTILYNTSTGETALADVSSGMRSIKPLEDAPALIAQLASDLTECFDCTWVVSFSPGLDLLATFGQHPDIDRCTKYLSAMLASSDGTEITVSLGEHRSDWAPRLVCRILRCCGASAILALGPQRSGAAYTTEDQDFIATVASQFSALLSNDRLAAVAGRRIEQLRQRTLELAHAREVQQRFLPLGLPVIHGIDYYGECRPAGEVGGDFFDFVAPEPSSLLLSVGDVSGKGLPSAMVMAGLQASLRSLRRQREGSMSTVMRDLNRSMWEVSPDNFFITMFYARIDSVRRELRYVNAGHEPPLLIRRRDRAIVRLESTGTVLGLSTRSTFEQRTIHLEPDDVLVAATDGITEAFYENGRDTSQQVMEEAVRGHPNASASDVAGHILSAVETSTRADTPVDDRTLVVVRLLKTSGEARISTTRSSHASAYATLAS